MVNKMFELLEARWLFGVGKYDAIIETQSLIHALIDFKDGSVTQNTRVSYPIYHIDNIVRPVSKAGHANKVIFLTADGTSF